MQGMIGISVDMLQRQNMSEAKTILVTGGSGYIGGMVCRLLVDAGHNVINIDRRKKDIPGVTLYPFDIDNHQIKGVIQLTKPDTIMHFAADHEVGRSMSEPGVFFQNNVANTITLLNHAVANGVKNFIFSSSSSVYGDITEFPTTENSPKAPMSSYGLSKSIIEDVLPDYKRAYGLNYAALRYFNAAGAHPDNLHGYTQEPASHIVPIISRKILAGEPVEVFGTDYDTKDGTCERDYTHVFDIATAHLAADNYLSDGGDSDIFNIGAQDSKSVLEVIEAFKAVGEVEVVNAPRRDGDAPKTYADNTKAREAFGWEPIYGLEQIVEHSFAWEKKNFKK